MAHAQKPGFVFRRNGRVHLNRRGCQFSRLLAAKVCASAVVMLDIPCSEVVWRVLATHSIRQFSFHFPSRASPCAITFQQDSNYPHPESISVECWSHGWLTWRGFCHLSLPKVITWWHGINSETRVVCYWGCSMTFRNEGRKGICITSVPSMLARLEFWFTAS
jgi:hypothetical protein